MTPAQRQRRYRSKLRRDLRIKPKQERRRQREAELAAATVKASLALGSKLYGVIYADPPWDWEAWSEAGMDRAAANHYPTMALDDIKAIKVPAAKDCVLFLWATAPMLLEALAVMLAWGFTYRTQGVWDKLEQGTGYWFRSEHEVLLVGTRGNVPAPALGTQSGSVFRIPSTRHSEKPTVRVPVERDHGFRWKMITQSGGR
jgi:N6-adenosine-specific RNA methylase IME4